MTYLLVGLHGALVLAGDPGAPRLPLAIGPGDEPLIEVPLLDEDPDADPPPQPDVAEAGN